MNTLKSTPELKAKAKALLLGKYGTVIPALLITEGIIFLISTIVVSFLNLNTTMGLIIYYVFYFAMQLLAGILIAGQCHLYLNLTCNCNYSVKDIFYGFRRCPDKAIYSKFMILIREACCLLPAIILYIIYAVTNITILLLFASLCGAVGMVLACLIALSYSQTFYLMLDFPQYSGKDLLSMSKKMMKGHRGSLFYLEMTFLPLILLSLFFTCGLGLLWVVPYSNATTTQFYLDLIRIKEA